MNTDLRDFNAPGHWYTSYPSLNHWTEDFGHKQYVKALNEFKDPLHLYLHIPFCKKLCYYCICNIVVSNDRAKIQHFLDHLLREIDLLKPYRPLIKDIHFGGGTPSHLDRAQFSQLCEKLNDIAPLRYMKEVAMEIDPRTVTQDDLRFYASCGVNRISFGIQDFNLKVQEAINRVQPPEMIAHLLEVEDLFKEVNFDLLYGLPHQTLETFEDTLDKTIEMQPDRITLLKYCHAPDIRKHMKLINITDLPPKDDLKAMFELAVEKLCFGGGYVWVGTDHFARTGSPLHDAVCRTEENPKGYLGRTFNGFTSGTTEMIGIGPTSTGAFGNIYCQNHYDLNEYYAAINRGEFPVFRGYKMTRDDLKRRSVIFDLLCRQSTRFSRSDEKYFSRELEILGQYPDICEMNLADIKGLFVVNDRLLLRNVCSVFDVKDTEPQHMKIAQKTITRRAVA